MNGQARLFPESVYLALKAAVRRACECAGGVTYLAERTRAASSLLSRYGSPSETMHMPVDMAIDADRLAGEPIILRAYAKALGFEIVPAESAEPGAEHMARHLGDVAKASGALVAEIGDAVADGKIDHHERRRIHEAAEALAHEVAEVAADTDPHRIVPRR